MIRWTRLCLFRQPWQASKVCNEPENLITQWGDHGYLKARACFQNAFAYLLAKTSWDFVAPWSRISSQYAPASRLTPACFGLCI